MPILSDESYRAKRIALLARLELVVGSSIFHHDVLHKTIEQTQLTHISQDGREASSKQLPAAWSLDDARAILTLIEQGIEPKLVLNVTSKKRLSLIRVIAAQNADLELKQFVLQHPTAEALLPLASEIFSSKDRVGHVVLLAQLEPAVRDLAVLSAELKVLYGLIRPERINLFFDMVTHDALWRDDAVSFTRALSKLAADPQKSVTDQS